MRVENGSHNVGYGDKQNVPPQFLILRRSKAVQHNTE